MRGQRARGTRPQKRGKNVSMIAAIALKGIVASVNLLGAADGLTFEAFVIQKLVPHLWKGACVVWDNATIHKGGEIEKAIIKAGAKLINLPPYSPDFNQARKFLVQSQEHSSFYRCKNLCGFRRSNHQCI